MSHSKVRILFERLKSSKELNEWETIDVRKSGDALIRGIDRNQVTGTYTSLERMEDVRNHVVSTFRGLRTRLTMRFGLQVPTIDAPAVIVSHKDLEERQPPKEKKKKKGEGAN